MFGWPHGTRNRVKVVKKWIPCDLGQLLLRPSRLPSNVVGSLLWRPGPARALELEFGSHPFMSVGEDCQPF